MFPRGPQAVRFEPSCLKDLIITLFPDPPSHKLISDGGQRALGARSLGSPRTEFNLGGVVGRRASSCLKEADKGAAGSGSSHSKGTAHHSAELALQLDGCWCLRECAATTAQSICEARSDLVLGHNGTRSSAELNHSSSRVGSSGRRCAVRPGLLWPKPRLLSSGRHLR